jgi:phosphonate transport system substrate-binding protein
VPSSQTSAARWQPLAAFVGEAVSANVDVDTEASYDAFEKALEQGKYDLANAGPVVCHDVRELYEPLARIERQAAPTYQGLVFVRRDSAARTLADLAGKRVGMVSARSTSGGLYPELALIQAGLDIKKDVTIVWLGSHEKVAAAVKAGEVDAGACYEDCRDSAWPDERAKAAATRVLAYTPPIPGEMLVVKRALDKPTKDALRKAVLALNDASGILAQISQGELTVTAFVPATEKDLEAVHDAIVRVTGETHP